MNRMFHVPLRAAAICLLLLACVMPCLAFQTPALLGDDDDDQASAGDSLPSDQSDAPTGMVDLQSLIRRLDAAESVIKSQQEQINKLQGEVGPNSTPRSAIGSWVSDGLTVKSKDGDFKVHFGGLAQVDLVGFANTPAAITIPGGSGIQEATNIRRMRIRAEGTMWDNIDWISEFDLDGFVQNIDQRDPAAQNIGLRSFPTGVGVQAGNTINVIQPTLVYLTFKDIPILGNMRIGNQQDWLSLEHIESARFLDFMERSPMMDLFSGPFNNGYTPGISVFNNTPDKMAGLQVGAYKNNTLDSGYTFNIGDSFTYGGRAIWTPYYDEESKGRYLLHTGFASEWRTFNTNVSATQGFDNVRLRSSGDLRTITRTLDPNFTDTGNFYAISQTLIAPEVALQWGPLLIQSEYIGSWFNGAKAAQNLPKSSLGDVFFSSGYCEVMYFLTGENRDYIRQAGTFGRVVPKETANFKRGTYGAWQLGARLDYVELNSGHAANGGSVVNGGNNTDMTLGLNWFLNANARFQFNYVCTWINNQAPTTFPGSAGSLNGARFVGDGPINSFGARMDFNF